MNCCNFLFPYLFPHSKKSSSHVNPTLPFLKQTPSISANPKTPILRTFTLDVEASVISQSTSELIKENEKIKLDLPINTKPISQTPINERKSNLPTVSNHPIEKYPINTLVCWESSDRKKHVLVKITEKRFEYENTTTKMNFKRSFLSTQHSQITIPSNFTHKMPVYEVLEHVTSRLKGVFCLDFSNGVGEYTLPWLKTAGCLISLFNNVNSCEATKENLIKTQSFWHSNLINFLDNEMLFKGKYDVLFINPYTVFPDFCAKNLNSNENKNFLRRIKSKANNFAMFLSINTNNFENLIDLLTFLSQKKLKSGFEIEKIYCNDKLKYLYLYQGDFNTISLNEEIDFFEKILLLKQLPLQNLDNEIHLQIHSMLIFLSNTIGNGSILKIIKIAQQKVNDQSISLTVFEIFKQLIKSEFKKNPSISFNPQHKHSKISLRVFRPSQFQMLRPPFEDENSFKDRTFSIINEERKFSEDEDDLKKKSQKSNEDFFFSDYSINNISNDNSNDNSNDESNDYEQNKKKEKQEFEIIEAFGRKFSLVIPKEVKKILTTKTL